MSERSRSRGWPSPDGVQGQCPLPGFMGTMPTLPPPNPLSAKTKTKITAVNRWSWSLNTDIKETHISVKFSVYFQGKKWQQPFPFALLASCCWSYCRIKNPCFQADFHFLLQIKKEPFKTTTTAKKTTEISGSNLFWKTPGQTWKYEELLMLASQ